MKFWALILCFVLVNMALALADCPPGQYNPGPDCSLEPICGLSRANPARRHYCDCWCNPGTVRDSLTNECVEKCPPITNPWLPKTS